MTNELTTHPGINFNNPVAGYYWLKESYIRVDTGEEVASATTMVMVAFVSYRKKQMWRVIGNGWTEALERYRDKNYLWEKVQLPTFGE